MKKFTEKRSTDAYRQIANPERRILEIIKDQGGINSSMALVLADIPMEEGEAIIQKLQKEGAISLEKFINIGTRLESYRCQINDEFVPTKSSTRGIQTIKDLLSTFAKKISTTKNSQ
ncbi:hypothetical protein KJ632_03705 [Patescibacteria group bacterium]|nr:hypothetical protein [Patescibacteria group bacterium]